jgi:hypothetical protein
MSAGLTRLIRSLGLMILIKNLRRHTLLVGDLLLSGAVVEPHQPIVDAIHRWTDGVRESEGRGARERLCGTSRVRGR